MPQVFAEWQLTTSTVIDRHPMGACRPSLTHPCRSPATATERTAMNCVHTSTLVEPDDLDMVWFAQNPERNIRMRWATPQEIDAFPSRLRQHYPSDAHFFVFVWRYFTPGGKMIQGRLNTSPFAFTALPPGFTKETMPDFGDASIAAMFMGLLRDAGMTPFSDDVMEQFRRGYRAAAGG